MAEGWLFVEEKDFIPTGSTKPKGRITVPLAFWPKGNEDNRDRVLDNMMKEHPNSRIHKKLPKTCKYECSDCDNATGGIVYI